MITGIANLTPETLIAYVGIFIGTLTASVLWYRKNYKDPTPPRKVAEDLVLTSGVIGDMAPVREAAASLKHIAQLLEEGVEEHRKSRHVWEKILQRLETNAEIEQRLAVERRRDRPF